MSITYAQNKKNKHIYILEMPNNRITNTTNSEDGQIMILYRDLKLGNYYVREYEEFRDKFDIIPLGSLKLEVEL